MRALVSLLLFVLAVPAWADWPVLPLPVQASRIDLGPPMQVNGLPVQMKGFLSQLPPARVRDWYRSQLGQHHVENQLGNKTILGKAEGDFYLTVQLEAAGQGTRGVLAVTRQLGIEAERVASLEAAQRFVARFPAGSRLLNQQASTEKGRRTNHAVLSNRHPVDLNRERLLAILADEGMALEREAPAPGRDGCLMLFRGRDREAMAVISRGTDGGSTIVLNTQYALEHLN